MNHNNLQKKKKKTLLLISGVVILSLLVGGGFLIYKNSSSQVNNSLGDKPHKEEKKPILPSDNPQPDPASDKTELKVFWSGQLPGHEEYSDYWKFVEGEEWSRPGRKWFLIPKSTPILVDKDLYQEDLIFNLSYSKKTGSRIEKFDKDGNPRLTILESNFTLTPLSPNKNDPDFLDRWENMNNKDLYFDYSQYSGGDYVFIDNQIQGERDEKDCDKFVFKPDNPSIQELLAKNLLQNQPLRNDKEFRVFYMERDIEKRVFFGNSCTYYFNNQAKVRRATN